MSRLKRRQNSGPTHEMAESTNWNREWDERLRHLALESVTSCTEALAERDPSIGASLLAIENGYAAFHGINGAMTAASNIGIGDSKHDEQLDAVEAFYKGHGCPTRIWTNNNT